MNCLKMQNPQIKINKFAPIIYDMFSNVFHGLCIKPSKTPRAAPGALLDFMPLDIPYDMQIMTQVFSCLDQFSYVDTNRQWVFFLSILWISSL